MEERRHLIPCNQRGLSLWGFGIVTAVIDDRQLLAQSRLLGKGTHPGTATLRRTAIVVAIEQRQRPTILIPHLKHLHVRMIRGDILSLDEVEAIHAVGGIEHTIELYAVDIEVGLHLVVRDVQQFFLHLRRIVETVIRLEFEVGAFGLTGIVLDGLRLGIGLGRILGNQVLQEVVDILRSLGHRLFQRVRGIVLIAHQFALLCTQLGDLHHNGEGVERLHTAVSTMT